jgi:ATP-binding cassette, subfamily B, bacterial
VAVYAVPQYDLKQAIEKNRLLGLIRMASGYRMVYVGAIASLAVSASARTAGLLLISYFVDEVLVDDTLRDMIPLFALGFVLLATIQGTFSYVSGRWAARTAEGVSTRLRDYLYDHVQRLDFSYHDRTQTGELLQRCTSDVDAVRRFYIEQGVGIGRILTMFIVNLIAIITINPLLAGLSVLVIPLLVVVSLFFFKRISDKYEAFQNQEARLSTRLQENLSGVRVVKAFGRQEYEIDKFEDENHGQFNRGRQLSMMHAYFWPTTDILTGFQMLFGYFAGALMVLDGTISIGSYLAYIGMVILIIFPMRDLGRLIAQTSTGLVSYDRVMAVIKEDREALGEDQPAPVDDIQGEVVFENVTFEYERGNPVLRDVSFRCEPGQTVALLGATGSGKTSMMALLTRFYDYTGGSIKLDDVELRDYPRSFLRQHIGIVEQEPFLFSRTIRENITYGVGREVSDDEVFAAAEAAAVHDVIQTFPDGYQTLVGERGVTLSGGQKQRVALARTILKDPSLLILDDATSSVDTETEAHIRGVLRHLMTDRTSFIIAHRITTVMHADLILVMDHGQVVQMGNHAELLKQDGVYRETYLMQSQIETELEKELTSV